MKSNRFIKRLDWYIIKKFLGTYVFAIALIISIAVVFDFNEKMDKLMEHEAPWDKIIFEYYMNFIPYFSNLFSPLFVFIAVIFFTSKLAENSEIIAMFSTGMSFKRMMRPYMISAAIIALTTFTLSSYVIPKGSVTRLNFEDRYIKPKKQNSVSNVQLEVDSGVIAYIDNYNNAMKTGNRFSLDKFVDKKLVSHLTARRITYDTATVHKWTIHDYMVRELDGLKEKITKGDRIDSIINMEPSDFLIMKNQQEMLTSPELSDYIEKQKRRGFANIKEFEIEYHKRIAMSFASFILTIIGVSLSSRKTKGGMGLHLSPLSLRTLLFYVKYTVCFTRSSLRHRSVSITEDAVAYALILSFNTPFFQQLFSFFGSKLFLSTVNPAAAKTYGMSRLHQVAHYQAAVIGSKLIAFRSQNNKNHRCAIKTVDACAQNFTVHLRQFVANLFIGYRNNNYFLRTMTAGSIKTGIDNLVNQLLRYHIRLIFTYASAFL